MSRPSPAGGKGPVTLIDPRTMTPRQQARRERLIEAGLRLLADRHYEDIQVKDVADEAEVALGTLYNYFSSKEHLFAEVLVRWAATLQTNVQRRPLRSGSTTEQMTEIFNRALRAFQRQPQLARLVATLEMSTDVFASEILGRLAEATDRAYLPVLAGLPSEDAVSILRIVNSVFSANLREWSLGRRPMTDVYENVARSIRMVLEFSVEDPGPGPAGGLAAPESGR